MSARHTARPVILAFCMVEHVDHLCRISIYCVREIWDADSCFSAQLFADFSVENNKVKVESSLKSCPCIMSHRLTVCCPLIGHCTNGILPQLEPRFMNRPHAHSLKIHIVNETWPNWNHFHMNILFHLRDTSLYHKLSPNRFV